MGLTGTPVPLPMGEVALRSNDGEGKDADGEAFLRLFPQKMLENPVYRTLPLLYSGQNEKMTDEGTGMKEVELRYVGGHVEVYTEAGAFLFSADTLREAMEELDAA